MTFCPRFSTAGTAGTADQPVSAASHTDAAAVPRQPPVLQALAIDNRAALTIKTVFKMLTDITFQPGARPLNFRQVCGVRGRGGVEWGRQRKRGGRRERRRE